MLKSEVNLHSHSYFSDGFISPRQLAYFARNVGLKALCLTDHDVFQGLPEFFAACDEFGIDTMTGIELTSSYKGTDIHILGYGFDLKNIPMLTTYLEKSSWKMRNERARRMLGLYKQAGIMDASIEDVQKAIPGYAPYIAIRQVIKFRALIGNMSDEEAFQETKRGRPFRVSYPHEYVLTPVEAVRLITKAGGKAVLAHPRDILSRTDNDSKPGMKMLEEVLERTISCGLFGIEAHYFNHSETDTRFYLNMAKKLGLFPTAGSDYHANPHNSRPLVVGGMDYMQFLELKKECAK